MRIAKKKIPLEIAQAALEFAKTNQHDVVIIDTAGRLAVDEVLMEEIKAIHQGCKALGNSVCGGFYDRARCRKYSKSL